MIYLKGKSRDVTVRGKQHRFEWLDFSRSVAVLPVLDDGRIVLIEQYRPSVDRPVIEIPAGRVERGETLEAAAARELEEETGYRAGRLRQLTAFYPSVGYSTEFMTVYLATGLTQGATLFDEAEEIRNVLVTPAEMAEWIGTGRIDDGKTILAWALWTGLRIHDV